MPININTDSFVRLVEGSPIGAAEVNAEITTQNAAGYWFSDMKFINSANALLFFVKYHGIFLYPQPQKVNEVDYVQAALDADKAAEILNGYWPTGIFIRPLGDEIDALPLIHYQRLDEVPV